MLEATGAALDQLMSWGPILAFVFAIPIALISGAIPGGGLPVMPVILAFAFVLEPWVGMVLAVTYFGANDLTEPIPAILMGVPGGRSAQATILDGYPMTRRGEAGIAIGASYVSTLIGGPVGALVLLILIPFGRQLLLLFGSAEFFLLSLVGIAAVGIVSTGAVVRGLLSATFGMTIAMVGLSNLSGGTRATFGVNYLYEGFPIVPVIIGLFAIPEFADLVVAKASLARERIDEMLAAGSKDTLRGMRIALGHKWLIVRCSIIGVLVAALPGLGATPAHWIAYSHARATEKGAKETFGTGDVRGIISSDAANNSADGGNLIPTLLFGIPGSAQMALFLGFLILNGVVPGPRMLDENLDLVMGIVIVLVLSNVVVVPIILLFARQIVRVAAAPANIISPVVIGIVTLAAYQATTRIGDLLVMVIFSVLGVFMKAFRWPRVPIIIAIVLTPPLEKYFHLAVSAYGWGMVLRPQFIAILVVVVLGLGASLYVRDTTGRAGSDGGVVSDELLSNVED